MSAAMWRPAFLGAVWPLPRLTGPRRAQHVAETVVTFVTRVLVDLVPRFRGEVESNRPGLHVRLRIVDGELVANGVATDTSETLHQAQVLAVDRTVAVAADAGAVGEVRRFDDQRIALPMAPRVAHIQIDALADARARLQRHHSRLVDHFVLNHDEPWRLKDRGSVAVDDRKNGAGHTARDAAVVVAEVGVRSLHAATALLRRLSLGEPLLALPSHLRGPPVGGIDDQRRRTRRHRRPLQPVTRRIVGRVVLLEL